MVILILSQLLDIVLCLGGTFSFFYLDYPKLLNLSRKMNENPIIVSLSKTMSEMVLEIKKNNLNTEDGGGSDSLDRVDFHKQDVEGFVARENGRAVGWCAYFSTDNCVQLYVRPEFRRKGIGSRMLRKAKRKYGKVTVFPWNHRSRVFFERFRGMNIINC